MKGKALLVWVNGFLGNCSSVLDVGCGDKCGHKHLRTRHIVTIDAWDKFNPDWHLDLNDTDMPYGANTWHVVLLMDFIEHLETKERGREIIEQCKEIARQYVLLLTPVKWDQNTGPTNNPKSSYYGNPFNVHKVLWTEEELTDLGFEKFGGVMGPKYFLGAWRKHGRF